MFRVTVCAMLAMLTCVLWFSSSCSAQPPGQSSNRAGLLASDGTSDKVARTEASRAMPYNRLRPEVASRVQAVVKSPTVYRRLPVTSISSDPDLFTFLVRNPEVVISIWKTMGVTSIDLKRTGQFRFSAHDGMGTASEVDLLYGTQNTHLYFGKGMYEGSLFKAKVFGQCVMLLRSVTYTGAGGEPEIRNVLDVFIKLDSPAINLVAKTFQPLFIESADVNFTETSRFLMKLSRTAELNPAGVEELAAKLPGVSFPVKQEFARRARAVSDSRTSRRHVAALTADNHGRSKSSRSYVSQTQALQTSRLERANLHLR